MHRLVIRISYPKLFILLSLFWQPGLSGFAQDAARSTSVNKSSDTSRLARPSNAALPAYQKKDTVDADSAAFVRKHTPWQPNPKKAGLYSSILPGAGQLYNRQYWKIPIVVAAGTTATYFITKNLNDYRSYRKAYIGRINNQFWTDQYAKLYSTDQLKQLQDDSKKYLDLSVLVTGVAYVLQVMDAVTSAHLRNFDISRDISMQVKPAIFPAGAGMGMVMTFR